MARDDYFEWWPLFQHWPQFVDHGGADKGSLPENVEAKLIELSLAYVDGEDLYHDLLFTDQLELSWEQVLIGVFEYLRHYCQLTVQEASGWYTISQTEAEIVLEQITTRPVVIPPAILLEAVDSLVELGFARCRSLGNGWFSMERTSLRHWLLADAEDRLIALLLAEKLYNQPGYRVGKLPSRIKPLLNESSRSILIPNRGQYKFSEDIRAYLKSPNNMTLINMSLSQRLFVIWRKHELDGLRSAFWPKLLSFLSLDSRDSLRELKLEDKVAALIEPAAW